MEDSKTKVDRPHVLGFNEIKQAADRIESGIIHTPLCEAKLSKCLDYDVYLKCENLQYTGSCVERGIRNAFLGLVSECTGKGVVVPSQCGNLGIAAAYHGRSLRVPVTVVMPNSASPALAQRCLEFGADVVLCGNAMDDVMAYANKVHRECDLKFLTSDHPFMMAGLGTVGIEIITQLPETDAVIVPVATGGLLAGILVACKKLKCSCLVYGAECAKVPKMMKALQAGCPTNVALAPSLAEGLNVPCVGPNAFSTIKGWLDRMLVVDEKFVARAMISMLEQERMVADGAGVCAIAAVMQGLVPELQGKRVVCVVTGGNIACDRLCRVVQRGLGANGRLVRFAVPVPDQRVGLEKLSKAVGAKNGVIKSIVTEPMWINSDVSCTWANIVVEVANEEQGNALKDHIRDCYPDARFACADPTAKVKGQFH